VEEDKKSMNSSSLTDGEVIEGDTEIDPSIAFGEKTSVLNNSVSSMSNLNY
jgi:high-affinity K+ transport system ATPase subunit B